jgi:hypothetical protein
MVVAGWREDLSVAARSLSIGVVGGVVTGLVVGGLGGRIAMFLLRLTSSSSLHGVETDDGAIIGVVSFATIFLLLVAAAVGILGGVLYLAIRDWLPRRGRAAVAAAFGGIVGGARLLDPHGLDFTALAPLWLAVALFVAIPAAYGAMTSALVERRLADRDASATPRWTTFAPLLLLPLLGPVGLAIAGGALLVWVLGRRWPSLVTLWRSSAVTWIGRAALVGFAAVRLAELVGDVGEIL